MTHSQIIKEKMEWGAGQGWDQKEQERRKQEEKEKQIEPISCLTGIGYMNYVVAWESWLCGPAFIHIRKDRKITLMVPVDLYYSRKAR